MAHVYFTSYARSDSTQFTKLALVLDDLKVAVRVRLGARPEDLVEFIDSNDILTGQHWRDVLATEIHSARVLVCLMSPTYFNSEWCAREFAVFRERIQKLSPGSRAIIPVLWERGPIPAAIASLQFNDARLPRDYTQNGLAALRLVKRTRAAYNETVRVLAEIIADIAQEPGLIPLAPMIALDDLPRSFDNPGPYDVALAVLHPHGAQWSIGVVGSTVARSVDTVASTLKVPWREMVYNLDLQLNQALSAAAQARRVIVVVVDEASATTEPFATYLGQLDATNAGAVAVLVGTKAPAADDAVARKLLPALATTGRHPLECFALGDKRDFETRLAKVVTKLRTALVELDPPSKVTDAALLDAADREGVPIATRPGLQSPGGVP